MVFKKRNWVNRTSDALIKKCKISEKRALKISNDYWDDVLEEVKRGLTLQPKEHILNGYILVRLDNIPNSTKVFYSDKIEYRIKPIIQEVNPLFKIVKKGNNLQKSKKGKGVLSVINPSDLLEVALNEELSLEETLIYVYGDDFDTKLEDFSKYTRVKLDLDSLQNYINTTKKFYKPLPLNDSKRKTLMSYVNKAQNILTIAKGLGFFPHFKSDSISTERTYYKYLNLQNCPKVVREASLGRCKSIDIENSVYTWKSIMAKKFDVDWFGISDYLDYKKSHRTRLAKIVYADLISSGKLPEEFAIKKIKEALTSLSFGARCKPSLGKKNALSKIFNKPQLERFANDDFVKKLVDEQKHIDDKIFNCYKGLFDNVDSVKVNGRLSRKKVVSYLYQGYEQGAMDYVFDENYKNNIVLNVHDGSYTRGLTNDDILNIRMKFDELGLNIKVEDINPYVPSDGTLTDSEREIQEHKEFIKQEESRAEGYVSDSATYEKTHNVAGGIDGMIKHIENSDFNHELLPELKEQRSKIVWEDVMKRMGKSN